MVHGPILEMHIGSAKYFKSCAVKKSVSFYLPSIAQRHLNMHLIFEGKTIKVPQS